MNIVGSTSRQRRIMPAFTLPAFTLLSAVLMNAGVVSTAWALGACCLPGGGCIEATIEECALEGGTYLGDNLPCDPNPCPGACCTETVCIYISAAVCDNQYSGTFLGSGVPCDPQPCLGACCLDGQCRMLFHGDCIQYGGHAFPPGTPCDPETCGPPHGCGVPPGRESGSQENGEFRQEAGPAAGVLVHFGARGDCGSLELNSDGSYENACAWRNQGLQAPFYGAFAECYTGPVEICAAVLDLTQTGSFHGQPIDVLVWDDEGGCPGVVRCLRAGVILASIAEWPSISRHVISLEGCCTGESYWVGCWQATPFEHDVYLVGADRNGTGGCPKTCVAPGIGYPTGWQNVSVGWGPTQALGIGVQTRACSPVPTQTTTWGRVKALHR